MPLVSEMQHPESMDFKNQRKVVMLRKEGVPWSAITEHVVKLDGQHHPSERSCRRVFDEFNQTLGRRPYKYHRCGRKAWKVTTEIKTFLVRKLLSLRTKCVCTSSTLQRALLESKGVTLDCSTIRKVLKKKGYQWLPRSQKRKYSKKDRQHRVAFAKKFAKMSVARISKEYAMAMDGVVLSLPPTEGVDRENYCHVGETHIFRKVGEGGKPELGGGDAYDKQIPYARAVPMWGGIGAGGFGLVMFHKWKKVDTAEWARSVNRGRLIAACKAAQPDHGKGPWRIICDNESFLKAPQSRQAHRREHVSLCHIPPRSPDLNPVEKFWAHVRRWLRAMDLADLRAGRPAVQKTVLKERVRSLLRSVRAKRAAQNTFKSLRKTCKEVIEKRGASTWG